jgi:hypothetical protein
MGIPCQVTLKIKGVETIESTEYNYILEASRVGGILSPFEARGSYNKR